MVKFVTIITVSVSIPKLFKILLRNIDKMLNKIETVIKSPRIYGMLRVIIQTAAKRIPTIATSENSVFNFNGLARIAKRIPTINKQIRKVKRLPPIKIPEFGSYLKPSVKELLKLSITNSLEINTK